MQFSKPMPKRLKSEVHNVLTMVWCHFAVSALLSFCCGDPRVGHRMLEGHLWVWALARAESPERAQGEGGISQKDCEAFFWSLPGQEFLLRGGVWGSMLLGLCCLHSQLFAGPEPAVTALTGSCYERRWEAECSCTLIT